MLGLRAHLFHQPRALDHVGEAWIVFDIGGDGELAARLQARDQHRLAHRARGVDRGGVAGRAEPMMTMGAWRATVRSWTGLEGIRFDRIWRREAFSLKPSG